MTSSTQGSRCTSACCSCFWQKAAQPFEVLSRTCSSCLNSLPWRKRHPQINPMSSNQKDGNLEWVFVTLGPNRVIRVVHLVPNITDRRRLSARRSSPDSSRPPQRHHSDSHLNATSVDSLHEDPATLPCYYDSDSSHSSFVAAVNDERMWRKCFQHRLVPRSQPNHVFTSRLKDRDGPTTSTKPPPEVEINGNSAVDIGHAVDASGRGLDSSSSVDGSYPNLAFQGDGDVEASVAASGVEAASATGPELAESPKPPETEERPKSTSGQRKSRSGSLETVRRSVLHWIGHGGRSRSSSADKREKRRRRRRRPRSVDVSSLTNSAFRLEEAGQVTTDPNGEDFIEVSASFKSRKPLKNNRLLFFIHGVGGSAETWKSQLLYFLGAGYEIVAPDMLGHGFSSAPDSVKAFKFKRLLVDLITIFDKFVQPGRKAVLVGHSYGCSFAAKIARLRPENVCLLVMMSGGGPAPLVPPTSGLMTLPTWLLQRLQPFLWFYIRRSLTAQYGTKKVPMAQAFDIPPYVLHHVLRGQNWPEGDGSFHRRIYVPALLIHGLQDPFVSLVEMCEMERTLPRAHLELLSQAGHMVMLDSPDQVNRVIHRFLLKYNRLTYCY